MKLLLDTHIAIWGVTGDPRLPKKARDMMLSDANEVFVSVVSLWEIAIKFRLRRGDRSDMPISAGQSFDQFSAAGFEFLLVTPRHALAVETLPPLHVDPFDRFLIAQARSEPLRLLTCDAVVASYGEGVERV